MTTFRATFLVSLAFAAAPAAPQAPAGGFGERVEVEVVNVDVVVTDASGRRITDLAREDFVLEVDGREVAIDYFAPPSARRPAPKPEPAPAAPVTAEPPAEIVDTATANLFVFVDQSALEWRTSSRILDEIRAFVMPRAVSGERIMIAAFAENLRILTPATSDRGRVKAAFDELEKLRGRGSLVAAERNRLEREVRENAKPRPQVRIIEPTVGGPQVIAAEQYERERQQDATDTEMLRMQIEDFAEQELTRQSRAVAALREWIGALSAIEGRKSVLFASAGYTSQPEAFLTRFLDMKKTATPMQNSDSLRLQTSSVDLLTDLESAVKAAQNARVAFYTVSPREVPSSTSGAEFASAGAISATAPPRDPSIAEAASSLQRLAVSTGGSALFLDDGLSDRLATVTDDASAAYSLGFSTGEAAGAGDHGIQVRTRRPGLEVRHRESFRRTSLGERAEAGLVAAATLETTVNPLALRLELGEPAPIDRKGEEALVPVLVRIPLALVTLVPEGDHRAARLSARIAVLNESRHVRLGTAAPIAISIPENELERALGSFWAYRAEVMVGRGLQRVAVVVVDENAGTVSTLIATVDRPE
jgi:VWFA-related protein